MFASSFKKVSRVMVVVGIAFITRAALAADQAPPQQQPQVAQPDPVVAGLVNQLQFSQDDRDRQKAAKELGKMADPGTLGLLIQAAVYDDASSVRKEARKSAVHISGDVAPRQGLVIPQDAVGALMSQLFDGRKDGDRENAARQLGAMANPASLPALEIAAVFDDDSDVRDAARKAAVTVRKVLAARAAQEQMNRSEQPAAPADSSAPASPAAPVAPAAPSANVTPAPAAAPAPSYAVPAAPAAPQAYAVPASPTVVAVQAAPQTVVVPPPVYYYPAPPAYYYYPRPYYYPAPAYYYPAPAYYGPRVSIGLGFGFGCFGHSHHR
jgi:hypothetical protein